MARIPASEATRKRLKQIFEGGKSTDESARIRESVRLMIEEALEAEASEALGRGVTSNTVRAVGRIATATVAGSCRSNSFSLILINPTYQRSPESTHSNLITGSIGGPGAAYSSLREIPRIWQRDNLLIQLTRKPRTNSTID